MIEIFEGWLRGEPGRTTPAMDVPAHLVFFGVAVAVCGLCAGRAAAEPQPSGPLRDAGAASRCAGSTELVAVVYNDQTPRRSFATVAGGGASRIISVGSWVEERPVLAVLPQILWLGPAGAPCWIPLDHDGQQHVGRPIRSYLRKGTGARASKGKAKKKAKKKRKRKKRVLKSARRRAAIRAQKRAARKAKARAEKRRLKRLRRNER